MTSLALKSFVCKIFHFHFSPIGRTGISAIDPDQATRLASKTEREKSHHSGVVASRHVHLGTVVDPVRLPAAIGQCKVRGQSTRRLLAEQRELSYSCILGVEKGRSLPASDRLRHGTSKRTVDHESDKNPQLREEHIALAFRYDRRQMEGEGAASMNRDSPRVVSSRRDPDNFTSKNVSPDIEADRPSVLAREKVPEGWTMLLSDKRPCWAA